MSYFSVHLRTVSSEKKLQISLSFMTQGMGAGGGCAPSCAERRKFKHTCIFKSEFSKTHLSNTLVVDHDRSKKCSIM